MSSRVWIDPLDTWMDDLRELRRTEVEPPAPACPTCNHPLERLGDGWVCWATSDPAHGFAPLRHGQLGVLFGADDVAGQDRRRAERDAALGRRA